MYFWISGRNDQWHLICTAVKTSGGWVPGWAVGTGSTGSAYLEPEPRASGIQFQNRFATNPWFRKKFYPVRFLSEDLTGTGPDFFLKPSFSSRLGFSLFVKFLGFRLRRIRVSNHGRCSWCSYSSVQLLAIMFLVVLLSHSALDRCVGSPAMALELLVIVFFMVMLLCSSSQSQCSWSYSSAQLLVVVFLMFLFWHSIFGHHVLMHLLWWDSSLFIHVDHFFSGLRFMESS